MVAAVATRFLQWGVVGLLIPVANLLRLSKGLDLAQLGFSAAIVSAVIVVLELPTGVLADRIGRKRTYLAAVAFQVASYSSLLIADGFVAVAAAFGLYGVSRALSSGSLEALLVDRYIDAAGKDGLHRLTVAVNAADTAGLALGSVAGGLLPALWASLAPAANRYHGNLIAMIGLSAVLGIVAASAVKERLPGAPVAEDPASSPGSIPAPGANRQPTLRTFIAQSLSYVRSDSRFKAFLGAAAAWGLAFSAVEAYWQPKVAALPGAGASDAFNGYLSAGYFLAALLGGLIAAPAVAKAKGRLGHLIAALRFLTGAFIVGLTFQGTRTGFAILYLSMFLWNGMASPAESTLLNGFLPPDTRASMLSAVSLAVQLGGFVGSIAFGLIVGAVGITPAWLIAAVALAASAALFVPMRGKAGGDDRGSASQA